MGLLKPNTNQRVANSTKETNETQLRHKSKSFAERGAKYIDDTSEHIMNFYAVQALENCEIDISGCSLLGSFTDFDVDFEIPSGCIIYISGTKIQFKTNSKAIVYVRDAQDPFDNYPTV
jgi:hypothetical protein|tara:strand:+ start:22 stop:378 length:357 start_codon:yes stop_codon:yes gene_type:complete